MLGFDVTVGNNSKKYERRTGIGVEVDVSGVQARGGGEGEELVLRADADGEVTGASWCHIIG